jgi:Protein of unknown function (DUF3309)
MATMAGTSQAMAAALASARPSGHVRSPASLVAEPGGEGMRLLLLLIVIILLIAALPTWPYSAGWGYYPGGILGLILMIVIVLLLLGRI